MAQRIWLVFAVSLLSVSCAALASPPSSPARVQNVVTSQAVAIAPIWTNGDGAYSWNQAPPEGAEIGLGTRFVLAVRLGGSRYWSFEYRRNVGMNDRPTIFGSKGSLATMEEIGRAGEFGLQIKDDAGDYPLVRFRVFRGTPGKIRIQGENGHVAWIGEKK